jgi:acetyltransferase-like isoleucine patch superfamily enzyme
VKELVVIGAGKFAIEVTRYIDDVTASGLAGYRITRYLAVDGDRAPSPAVAGAIPIEEFEPAAGAAVVVALSDSGQRREVIDDFVVRHGLAAENIVHPSARVDGCRIEGAGNIVGPHCYLGAGVTIGSFNVLHYHCTFGHHTCLGSNNFVAPNFHCGNSVVIGDDNFFGLSCTVAPEVVVGDDCRFSAGLTLLDSARSGHSYLVPSRIKAIKSSSGGQQ